VNPDNPGAGTGTTPSTPIPNDGEFSGGIHSGVKTASGFTSSGSMGAPVKEIQLQTPHGYKFYFTVQGQTFSSQIQ
jgi:hypothetical protein